MIGRVVSHYRILSTLGSGGMGVVYLAEDSRLGRQVALKFMPASWSQDSKSLERFRVEARAASSLSHPGICAIYDIGQDGETPFIVMEALKGETLRERITKGPLKVGDVLDIGIQLADALEAAHAQGIVHRDIKPANIFLGDRNRVKVLDFGLAKVASAPSSLSSGADTTTPRVDSNQMTQPGTALGTVTYMSPEQARGEPIDSRTDLFSLGAVMYEMVTGTQAFGGTTTAVAFDAILNRTPRPIAHLNPLIPPRLETLIATALEKDRDLRYQHASDIQAELRRIRRDLDSGSLAGTPSVATTPGASVRSVPVAVSEPSKTAARWREQGPFVVGCVSVLIAAALFWFGQNRTENGPVATTAAVAPAAAPAPPPAVAVPPAVPPSADPPAAAASRTRSERAPQVRPQQGQPSTPAPARQPSPQSAPPPPAATAAPVNSTQPDGAGRTPTPPPAVVAPVPNPAATTSPAADDVKPQPSPATPPPASTAAAPVTAPPPAPAQTPAPAPRAAAAPEPARPAAVAPVETDDAAIRRVIRTFEQAIETEDIALYRSVRPGLTPAAEAVVRSSFKQVDAQEIDIRIESIRIDGRNATARLARRDTLVTAGRRQVQNSTQTMRFQKTDAGWIIAE